MERKIFSWDFLMTTVKVLFPFFVGLWENHFGLANFFFNNLPLKLFNFNFIWFFPKKKNLILNLEEKNEAGQERKKKFRLDILKKKNYSNYTPAARRGYTVLPLSVCLSVRPSFQDIFLSNLIAEI